VSGRTISFTGAEGNLLAASLFEPSGPACLTALLLHGGGQTRHAWDATGARFAKAGIRGISFDARGHGKSEWAPSGHYRFTHLADDLQTVAKQVVERHGPTASIGASMGGLTTMLVNEREPDLFHANVFVDITPRMQESGVSRIMGFMAEHSAEGFASVEQAADAIAAYMPNRPRPKDLSGLAKNLRERENGRFYWHWDPAFAMGETSIISDNHSTEGQFSRACTAITCPTLLVRGAQSDLIGEDNVAHFRSLVPHADYVDISDAGHMIVGDRNDVFAQTVLDYLERLLESH
jgi:pimeloyl-ACP methyl ester carboxylesterase